MNQSNHMSKESSDLILTEELERLRAVNMELRLEFSREKIPFILKELSRKIDKMDAKLDYIYGRIQR